MDWSAFLHVVEGFIDHLLCENKIGLGILHSGQDFTVVSAIRVLLFKKIDSS